ncbi:F-box/LRR-repeat protein [Tripterygium wilfordii]|uniref:F-box/LRR-repeat protein n=1 Tax=Tripterygium wilfordii TaxID=458696 RepID=A0A7J7C3B0_TRIWF|nr:F-box/LRR-repeat protein [Tripterygium wilfordii]
MDAINEPKWQKLREDQDTDGSEKGFCRLPDVVLQHILSFLPTKDAVRTSILSKRWEYLWTSIPNLEFSQGQCKRIHLMEFVERVFSHRDSDIKLFSITCEVLAEAGRIRRWISAAIRRNVKELYFDLNNFKKPFELPHCLFTSASVEKLFLSISCTLRLPTSICFSKLKILHLELITFPDDHSA